MEKLVRFSEWVETGKCAQGELYISMITDLPNGLTPMESVNDVYIVAHSETGHHHVIQAKPGCEIFLSEDPMTFYLRVADATEVVLEHLRKFDNHRPIQFLKGMYRFRLARERTPAGWRRVID